MKKIGLYAGIVFASWLSGTAGAQLIGETPAVQEHLNQGLIELGVIRFDRLFKHGNLVFDARFNYLDGRGRPGSTGTGAPRNPLGQPEFLRTSGPDANSCQGCHNQPRSGGAADFVANVFVLAQALDPVTESISSNFSNERNTLGMMGAGPIEMLAREMSTELIAIRTSAKQAAQSSGTPQTRDLIAKGVRFGRITVLPDGRVDPTQIEGVDWDLIVKPFHQKGAVVSLREFTNNAMNHHHGIQTVERFGAGVDADQDGVVDELSVGDVTAATIYQAALNTPTQVMPRNRREADAVRRGAAVFGTVGCTQCHVPEFRLASRFFTEPNPFNPAGNLRVSQVTRVFEFDMTKDGERPRLEAAHGGGALVRPFTDLKRHNLNDADLDHFANEQIAQGTLVGFASASDFTVPPQPRPKNQFVTRKLWDCGNSDPYGHRGDLSTATEAIWFHGGEARTVRDAFFALPQADQDAVIEFLKAQQVVPPQGKNERE
jgi:hypothetical protein